MVHGASRNFLTPAESRHAVVDLDLLAVAWAIMTCNMFLCGLQNFQVITDHSPLVPTRNNHRLDEIDKPRLQCLY